MSRRWQISANVDDRILRIRGWRAGELLREGGWRPIFAGGGWTLDAKHAADVITYIEYRGPEIVVTGKKGSITTPSATPPEDDLLDLLGS